MGATNFPNGVSSGGVAVEAGTASIAGAGTITTTLDTISGVVPSIAGVPGTASNDAFTVAGTALANAAGAATFVARLYKADGTAGTATKAVSWVAFGTKA